MAQRIPARLTSADGRRFAFTLGIAFVVLGGALYWRGRTIIPFIAIGAGTALLLAGATIPQHLGPVYRAWMRFALALSTVTTPLFIGIVFYGVVVPIGVLRRLIGRNPLERTAAEDSFWLSRSETGGRGGMTNQF